jgi:hypothetical protein
MLGMALSAALVATGVSSTASAAPGDHIPLGNAIITPSIDVGWEHRTNAFQTNAGGNGVNNLLFAPHLEIAAEGPRSDFTLASHYEGRFTLLFGRSDAEMMYALDRWTDFNVEAQLNTLKGQVLQLGFTDSIGMRNNLASVSGVLPSGGAYQRQFRNAFSTIATVRAGPSLDIRLHGNWAYSKYWVPFSNTGRGFRDLNTKNEIGPRLDVQWTFFPRTAIILESELTLNRWKNTLIGGIPESTTGPGLGAELAMPDSLFSKTRLGVRGRFTPRLVVVGMAGYGIANYDEASVEAATELTDFGKDLGGRGIPGATLGMRLEPLLVQLQAKYELGPTQKLVAGYDKDFVDSWFTNYMAYNELYGRWEGQFVERVNTGASISYRRESYAGEITRSDDLVRAGGDVGYQIQDFASITGGVAWVRRLSSKQALDYDDVNIHVSANFTY